MEKVDLVTLKGALIIGGAIVLAMILYAIGHQDADNLTLLLLSLAALALGVPLLVTLYPAPEGSMMTARVMRIFVMAFVTVAAIVVTGVIGYLLPEHRILAPVIFCLVLVLTVVARAP